MDDGLPAYLARWEVGLHDPKVPATGQPHHEVMELPWTAAQAAARPLERRIEEIAIQMLSGLLGNLQSRGFDVDGIGVVGSPDRKLDRIGNPHIRAHAAEGILFRRAWKSQLWSTSYSGAAFPTEISKNSPFHSCGRRLEKLTRLLQPLDAQPAGPGARMNAPPPLRRGS